MPKVRASPCSRQPWAAFVRNHARDIWACDFTVAYDWLFRPWYIFVMLELKMRRIVPAGVSTSPTDAWTAQPLREATPGNQDPQYLIRDRDSQYGSHCSAVAGGSGMRQLKTPFRAPQANAICERLIGSLGKECLDHTLVFHDRHLGRVVQEYAAYYKHDRPHPGIRQQIPDHFGQSLAVPKGSITSKPILGGLHHADFRSKFLN